MGYCLNEEASDIERSPSKQSSHLFKFWETGRADNFSYVCVLIN